MKVSRNVRFKKGRGTAHQKALGPIPSTRKEERHMQHNSARATQPGPRQNHHTEPFNLNQNLFLIKEAACALPFRKASSKHEHSTFAGSGDMLKHELFFETRD